MWAGLPVDLPTPDLLSGGGGGGRRSVVKLDVDPSVALSSGLEEW